VSLWPSPSSSLIIFSATERDLCDLCAFAHEREPGL
jgi:hypothetical protein